MSASVASRTASDVAGALYRAGVYRVLGGAFAYPTAERIGGLAAAAARLVGGAEDGPVRSALAAFRTAAAATEAEAAGAEHVFLFDRQVRCPAYEGAWGGAGAAAGRVARLADVAGFYRAFGLEATGAQPESEDHLVPELEFMSVLALKEAWARNAGDDEHAAITRDAAAGFLSEHLGRWAPAFAEEVQGATALPYYRTAAGLLAAWIAADVAALDAAPDVLRARGDDPVQADAFTCPMAPDLPTA